jgi:hypothetical protein
MAHDSDILSLVQARAAWTSAAVAMLEDYPRALDELNVVLDDLEFGCRWDDRAVDPDAIVRFVGHAAALTGQSARPDGAPLPRTAASLLGRWRELPVGEPLLADTRWPAPPAGTDTLEIHLSAAERDRLERRLGARGRLLDRAARHTAAHPQLRTILVTAADTPTPLLHITHESGTLLW